MAAAASYGLTQLAVRAINRAGGFYLHAIPGGVQISQVGRQLGVLGQNLMYLFGANVWGTPQPRPPSGTCTWSASPSRCSACSSPSGAGRGRTG